MTSVVWIWMSLFAVITLPAPLVCETLPRVDNRLLEKLGNAHKHWYLQTVDGLMGAMATQALPRLRSRLQREHFGSCYVRSTDISQRAQCLSDVFDAEDSRESYKPLQWVGGFAQRNELVPSTPAVQQTTTTTTTPSSQNSKLRLHNERARRLLLRYRSKRTKRDSPPQLNTGHLSGLARLRYLNGEAYDTLVNQERPSPYASLYPDNTEAASACRGAHCAKARTASAKVHIVSKEKMPNLPVISETEQQQAEPFIFRTGEVARFLTRVLRNGKPAPDTDWQTNYLKAQSFRQHLAERHRVQEQLNQQAVLLDSMLGGESGKNKAVAAQKDNLNSLIDPSLLLTAVGGDNQVIQKVVQFAKGAAQMLNISSTKVLSPRFLPLFPTEAEGGETAAILSPSMLGFFDDEKNGIASVPSLLKTMPTDDKHAWMEFLMEATGAADSMDKVVRMLSNLTQTQKHDAVEAKLKQEKFWADLSKSYTRRQNHDMKKRGYAFLDRFQLDKLYGKEGAFNYVDHGIDLDRYSRMNSRQKDAVLKDAVRALAGQRRNAGLRGWNRRLKQTTLSPFIFEPGVLAPGVLGPVTLSPSIFSPPVLSPVVLSPLTLSPSVGNPVVLSPFLLGPTTLSPAVMQPFVLSPYVLAPNIVNPYVLSPLVLSPYVLSPDILSPVVLSGPVLSPYVLSPAILSPGAVNADVLSPSVLSK